MTWLNAESDREAQKGRNARKIINKDPGLDPDTDTK